MFSWATDRMRLMPSIEAIASSTLRPRSGSAAGGSAAGGAGAMVEGDILSLSLEDWNRALAVNATGSFLTARAVLPALIESGAGAKARGGASYAAWACDHHNLDRCERDIRARGDMQRVRVALARDYRPGAHCAHLSIYVYRG